jgi:hypothetical protein
VDREGNLQPDKVGPVAVNVLKDFDRSRARRQPDATAGDPCGGLYLSFPEIEHYKPHATLNDLIVEANDVFTGRVSAIEPGFFRGVPASMLRVHILRAVRSSGAVRDIEHDVLIPYPNATIVAAGSTYCTRAPGKLVPNLGDRLLVFSYLPGEGTEHNVVEVDAGRELVLEQGGAVIRPPQLAGDSRLSADVSFDRLVQLVGEAVSRRGDVR